MIKITGQMPSFYKLQNLVYMCQIKAAKLLREKMWHSWNEETTAWYINTVFKTRIITSNIDRDVHYVPTNHREKMKSFWSLR